MFRRWKPLVAGLALWLVASRALAASQPMLFDQDALSHFRIKNLLAPASGAEPLRLQDVDHKVIVDGSDLLPNYLSLKLLGESPVSVSTAVTSPPLNGLKVWLKADAGVSASGSNVTAWADQSGSGFSFVAAGGGPAPVLVASSLNGLPVVRFNNTGGTVTSCYLTNASVPIQTWAGITVLYVIRTPSSGSMTTGYQGIVNVRNGANARWAFDASSITDGFGVGGVGASGSPGLGTYSPALANSQVVVQAYRYDKTAWRMTGAYAGTVSDTSFPVTTPTMFIGSADFSGGQSTADVEEVLIWDHSLTDSDLAIAEAYAQGRDATAIPGTTEVLVASHAPSGIAAGTYAAPTVTFDTYGHATSATAGSYAPTTLTFTGTAPISFNGSHAAQSLTSNITAALDANGVTYPFLQQGGALSIPGRASNSTGAWADIPATAGTGCVFRESGSTLGCGALNLSASGSVAGTLAAARLPGFTGGDVTSSAGSLVLNLNNIPNDTTGAGDIKFTTIAAPVTPASGTARCYVDSTGLDFTCKNASGVITHGAQTTAAVSHNFATALDADGTLHLAQPTEGDVVNLTTDLAGKVPTTRLISTAGLLSGGGDLSADRSLSIQVAANSIAMNPTASTAAAQAVSLGTTSGVVEYVNSTTDSFSIYAAGANRIPYGSGTSGQFTDSVSFTYDGQKQSIATTDAGNIAISLSKAGPQVIQKAGTGNFDIGTAASGQTIGFYVANGADKLTIDGTTGNVTITSTLAVNTIASSSIVATDASHNLTAWGAPASGDILLSNGSTISGNGSFTYDGQKETIATTDAGNVSLSLSKTGPQVIQKNGTGAFDIGTGASGQTLGFFVAGGADKLTIDGTTGNVNITSTLSLSGLAVNSLVATDASHNLVAATVPAAGDVIVSSGTGITGDATFFENTATHLLTVDHLSVTGADGSGNAIYLGRAGLQQINRHGGIMWIGTDDANPIEFYTNNSSSRFTIASTGVLQVPGIAINSIVATDAAHNLIDAAEPIVQHLDWSQAFANSGIGLPSSTSAYLFPSGNTGTEQTPAGYTVAVGGSVGTTLASILATSVYPIMHVAQRAMTSGSFRCSVFYGQGSGSGGDTTVFTLNYSTNLGGTSSTQVASISTSNVGSSIGNIGTVAVSSIPSGAYVFMEIHRSDVNTGWTVVNLNFRCQADLW